MDKTFSHCIQKAAELKLRDYKDGFVVACTNWSENPLVNELTFDIYLITEIDIDEGRISAIPCANFSRNCWRSRDGEPLNFWVQVPNYCDGINQLRYFHPSDSREMSLIPQPVFSLNISCNLPVATTNNRKQKSKTLFKKREIKNYRKSKKIQDSIKQFILMLAK